VKTKIKAGVQALAVAMLFTSQLVMGADVSSNSTLKLNDSYGNNNGGEFLASVLSGSGMGATFLTFCVEHNETFSYGQTLYVKNVNTGSVNGGITNADNGFTGPLAPTSNFDPISYETAYLYTNFSNQTLSNYQFLTNTQAQIDERVADGTSLQRAIWYLEGERDSGSGNWGYDSDTQAKAWVTEAAAATANWTSIGQVRVLNLYKDSGFTQVAQDQLYIAAVPEPEIYAMLGLGLGLMGFTARRRKSIAA